MPKHIILIDTALSASDVILTTRTALPQTISGLAAGDYTVRNTSAPVSGTVTAAGANTAPAQFASAGWSVATGSDPKQITISVATLPANGGSAITALQYTTDGGSTWTALAGTGTGERTVELPAASTAYDVQIRAVNTVGNGTASAVKTVTSGAEIGSSGWAITDDFTVKATGALVGKTTATGAKTWLLDGTITAGSGLGFPSAPGTAVAPADTLGANVAVEAVLNRNGANAVRGVIARATSDGQNYYNLSVNQAGDTMSIRRFVSGASTTIVSGNVGNINVAAGVDARILLEVEGTAIRGYLNGTLIISATDTQITAAGGIGFRSAAGDATSFWKSIRAQSLASAPAAAAQP